MVSLKLKIYNNHPDFKSNISILQKNRTFAQYFIPQQVISLSQFYIMEYNTQREKMIIPEYGRNVQKMIEQVIKIEDQVKRTQAAYVVVNIMSQLNPGVRDSTDYQRTLWDHMYIISDFRLVVDGPFPPPSREELAKKPERVPYSEGKIKFPHYGKNIEGMIEKAITFEEGPEKEALILTIANHLKKSYLNWNRDSVNDETIVKHLRELSKGALVIDDSSKLTATGDILSRNRPKQKKKFQQKGNGKRKNYQQRNF